MATESPQKYKTRLRGLPPDKKSQRIKKRSAKVFGLILAAFFLLASDRSAIQGQPYLTLDTKNNHKVIMLDPGHGGHEYGAVGPSGVKEKDVTLAIAKYLQKTLQDPCVVRLTRDGDYWLDVQKRTATANHDGSHLFVSLHAGGSLDHRARGMAVFYYGKGLLSKQNAGIEEHRLSPLPWDEIQTAHTVESKRLAKLVHECMCAKLDCVDRGIHSAPISVLQGADMPAILVELGYLSHPAEEKDMEGTALLSKIAEAMAEAIRAYFEATAGCVGQQGMIGDNILSGRSAAW
jgi:N-acetylmuramoyl-L-alanine amidase